MDNSVKMEQAEKCIKDWFAKNEDKLVKLSKHIWELAELKFNEFESVKALTSFLKEMGFTIKDNLVENMPTAFIAEWSNGKGPVIATLGEYDALTNLGHEIADTKKPNGKNGHGCGHNLLGVGSLSAAVSAKEAMQALDIKGTIRYYGCPAEEGGGAKVFMVRDGLFDGIDALVRWHPLNVTYVSMSPSLALYSIRYQFHGKTAHAGVNPHLGRSALDAALLMDVGVNYLREHIPTNVRVHSIITKGGDAPNIVPEFAEIWYYVRAPKKVDVDDVVARMEKIAKGMAMATETTVTVKMISASSEVLPNQAICDSMLKNLQKIGPPVFTDEEKAFAKKMNEGLSTADKAKSLLMFGITDPSAAEKDLYDGISLNMTKGVITPYSTDSGDVSWQTPTGQVFIASQTIGTANHSWQQVVCSGMSIGEKGMFCAGKTMALTAVDILTDPDLLAKAKEEYDAVLKQYPYSSPLPPDLKPNSEE